LENQDTWVFSDTYPSVCSNDCAARQEIAARSGLEGVSDPKTPKYIKKSQQKLPTNRSSGQYVKQEWPIKRKR